ncbi:MAG: M4 family metallopeptidase [Phaeodactylibacter sp.]|nr:M4 family metallopeptidase [Phaeodactylibacter sp.]MCB9265442.1 M4 family metallopeptidase [Lewinellaceae bacterium]
MKKNFISYKLWLVVCFLLAFGASLTAQQKSQPLLNDAMKAIASPESRPGWIVFPEDNTLKPEQLFVQHREAFQLRPQDEMRLHEVKQDDIGFSHFRYEQYHQGLRVYGGEYIVHAGPDGLLRSANGQMAIGLQLRKGSVMPEAEALRKAMAHADGEAFLWLDEEAELNLKAHQHNDQASYYPEGELVLHRKDPDSGWDADNFSLAWKFDLYMGLSGESRRVFIDAHSGELLNYLPISQMCDTGRGQTTWDGKRTISTDRAYPFFTLFDDCTGSHPYTLRTYDLQRSGSTSNRRYYLDLDNDWEEQNNQSGVQAHWAMHRTRDYFEDVHHRDSWDDDNGDWIAYNEATVAGSHNNACWNCFGGIAAFGGGSSPTSPNDDWNTLDIVGHEFTHGVVQTSAGLEYQGESGALNESFADIFGELVERHARGNLDWLVGGDRGAIRSFSNPLSFGDPKNFKGTNWVSGSDDNGGVHTNSGVQNYWFYLLSLGGSGTNEFGNGYDVVGIGIDKARAVAYRNLNYYLTSTSRYIDAREGSIRAATDLFGPCSNEVIQVAKAWYAVNVGSELSRYDYQICGVIHNGFFRGINSVQAGGSCTTTATSFFGNVAFTAGKEIILKPGFSAVNLNSNFYFSAYLSDCSYTVWNSPAGPSSVQAAEAPLAIGELNRPEGALHVTPGRQEIILQANPNPFSGQTSLAFTLPEPSRVSLVLYSLNGKAIRTLLAGQRRSPGEHREVLNADGLPPGLYLCRLITNAGSKTIKLILE